MIIATARINGCNAEPETELNKKRCNNTTPDEHSHPNNDGRSHPPDTIIESADRRIQAQKVFIN